jgi:hypothetical protein
MEMEYLRRSERISRQERIRNKVIDEKERMPRHPENSSEKTRNKRFEINCSPNKNVAGRTSTKIV